MVMKLKIQNRYKLPENTALHETTNANVPLAHISRNGNIITLGIFDDGELDKYCIISLSKNEIGYSILHCLGNVRVSKHHNPVLIAIDENCFGIIDNGDTLYIYEDFAAQPKILKINNHEIFSELKEVPRANSLKAVGSMGNWLIIFADSVLVQNPRFIVELKADNKDEYSWYNLFSLNHDDFPKSIYVPEFGSPTIGSSVIKNNRRLLFVEGSDSKSVNKWGMDYYSLIEVDNNGNILNKLYEVSGLKHLSGKHGVRCCFTSSKEYLILTPVFSSGEWKGKQKIFSLSDNTLIDVEMPRGTKGFKTIEHANGNFYLSDFYTEIMVCTAV